MKKFFTFIAAALFAGSMFAETAMLQYTGTTTTNMGEGNNAALVGLDESYFTVKSDKGGHSQQVGLNKDGSIRLYAKEGNGNTLSVSINGGSIQSFKWNLQQSATYTVTAGEGESAVQVEEKDGAFAINAKQFAIKNVTTGATTQLQIKSITIEYELDGSVLGKPVITPDVAVFEGELEVTITAAEGAQIYYTLDGTDPAVESALLYDVPFKIYTTTVVKAMATKYEQVSGITTKKYSVMDTVSVSEARKLIDEKDDAPHYVRGVAAGAPFIFGTGDFKGNIVLWMTDEVNAKDSLEAYYIAGKDNQPWESLAAAKDEIQSGDTVLVYASKLSYYEKNKVYEIEKGYYAGMLGKYQEDPSIKYDTLNVAQAKEICDTLGNNISSETKYYIEGYAVYADPYDALKGNQIFFMVDDPAAPDSLFEAYLATPKKEGKAYPVLNGDKVRVFGLMKKYVDAKNNNRVQLEVTDPTVEFLEEVEGDRTIVIPSVDTISVAQAIEIGKALKVSDKSNKYPSEKEYVIKGYSCSIETPYDEGYKNETFWIADEKGTRTSDKEKAFEVYRGKPNNEKELGLDALVQLRCKIVNFGGTIENYESNVVVEVLEEGIIEKLDTITVARALEIGNELATGGVSEKSYAIKGYVSSIQDYFNEEFKNETFWITDEKGARTSDKTKAFEVYRGKPNTQKEIGLDALIVIACKIKNYNGTIENDGVNLPFEVVEQGKEVKVDTINVAQAMEIGNALADNAYSDNPYVVVGYVTKAYDPDEGKTQQNFYMADEPDAKGDFYAYKASPDSKVNTGDFVRLFGKIQKYVGSKGTTIELSYGAVTHLPIPKVDTLTVAEALELGQKLADGEQSERVAVKGFVAAIDSEWEDDIQSFSLNDDKEATGGEFKAIDAIVEEPGAKLHDVVLLLGKIEHVSGVVRMVKAKCVVNPGEGLENIVVPADKARKIMVDGVLYIVRDNKIFNVQGAQVR